MSEPMYCPLSFGNPAIQKPVKCTPGCAWIVETEDERYGCGMLLVEVKVPIVGINTRPLKSDVEMD